MSQQPIRNVVIVGGGTAGWMTAAALARLLPQDFCRIRLVESDEIGTVGVGEATIPAIHDFNRRVGLDEKEFMAHTNATFKLGIEFVNWGNIGDAYMHPFGRYGRDLNGVGFHHYWLRERQAGSGVAFGDYSLPYIAARRGRFDYPKTDAGSVYSTYSYAFHFDASLYARYLRRVAEGLGVLRIEGRIIDTELRAEDGYIQCVVMEDGSRIDGELFVDCSGFRGLLIEQALQTGYVDWRHWLPCDRAFAVASDYPGQPDPYTRATAYEAGWQWRIPLQHRMGNGHVFSSEYTSEERAAETLLDNLDGKAHAAPRLLRFVPGKRRKMWHRNCVAIGLSGGFLEPLESTSIFLIQAAIMKLIELFPDSTIPAPAVDEYNRSMDQMFDEVRNFIILHYKQTSRDDSEFWRYCRNMSIPDELDYRMRLFAERGIASHRDGELFIETNWIAVYLGQKLFPEHYDPRVDCLGGDEVSRSL
ncbi:MAG: tryptophan halogenase family protein, partial [Wenzhouxiangellaceae bacterium]